jgi:hypothetical protein
MDQTLDERIMELAESLGVSVADFMCLANGAVNDLVRAHGSKENAIQALSAESEEVRQSRIMEAASNQPKKLMTFWMIYLKNEKARKAFNFEVYQRIIAHRFYSRL